MSLSWQYDLNTDSFNTVAPLTMNVRLTVNNQISGQLVFGPDTVRTFFGPVQIESPLFSLLGFDTSSLVSVNSGSAAQGNNGAQNYSWLSFGEDFSGNTFTESRNIQFGGPPMVDPFAFTSANLREYLLLAAVGGTWGMRDDGARLQNLLQGTIDSITISNEVPEPSLNILVGSGIAAAWLLKRRQGS